MDAFEVKKQRLNQQLRAASGKLRLQKKTISNLFRYQHRSASRSTPISLAHFDSVLEVDRLGKTLTVEGLTTYERIVDTTLPHGLLPTVTPELKHITIGGAIVGIGIESSCFRYGFVHDGLREADVLLPDGRIVTCTPDNQHADLFRALPNSYGTLGYILRARIELVPAKPYVHIESTRYSTAESFLDAMRAATRDAAMDFIEGLFVSGRCFYLLTARFTDRAPHVDDIVRESIYYQLVQEQPDVNLTARDYVFRYDPEWFWNIPDGPAYRLFRRYAPKRFRNSRFYTKYARLKENLLEMLPWRREEGAEPLIQDWQVPWDRAVELIDFAVDHVDLEGRPWAAVPIRTPSSPTLYPIEPETLYFNLGSYTHVKPVPERENFYLTRIMDQKCFELGGIKMLYSSSFLSKEDFGRIYNGTAYAELKQRYDPSRRAYELYDKAVTAEYPQ